MELEKSNETVWSIKRKGKPGNFLLRSIEQAGEIITVSISLEENGNEVTFQMKYSEFINFYGIITSFKDSIESSGSINPYQKEDRSEDPIEKNITSDFSSRNTGGQIPVTEKNITTSFQNNLSHAPESSNIQIDSSDNLDHNKMAQLDEGLANLEKMFNDVDDILISKNNSSIKKTKIPPKQEPTFSHPHEESLNSFTSNTSPRVDISPIKVVEKEKKKDLKESDWDPW